MRGRGLRLPQRTTLWEPRENMRRLNRQPQYFEEPLTASSMRYATKIELWPWPLDPRWRAFGVQNIGESSLTNSVTGAISRVRRVSLRRFLFRKKKYKRPEADRGFFFIAGLLEWKHKVLKTARKGLYSGKGVDPWGWKLRVRAHRSGPYRSQK